MGKLLPNGVVNALETASFPPAACRETQVEEQLSGIPSAR